jgi:hypothetical protein
MAESRLRFSQIIQEQLSRHPLMQERDIYKLLHQAAMGSEHSVNDETSARLWLLEEIAQIGNSPADPLWEEISPDGQVLRVNLRPFLEKGFDPESLLQAFLRTANEYQRDEQRLRCYSGWTQELIYEGMIPLLLSGFSEFIEEMRQLGFPAVHHSLVYEQTYRPAYRVVVRNFLQLILT